MRCTFVSFRCLTYLWTYKWLVSLSSSACLSAFRNLKIIISEVLIFTCNLSSVHLYAFHARSFDVHILSHLSSAFLAHGPLLPIHKINLAFQGCVYINICITCRLIFDLSPIVCSANVEIVCCFTFTDLTRLTTFIISSNARAFFNLLHYLTSTLCFSIEDYTNARLLFLKCIPWIVCCSSSTSPSAFFQSFFVLYIIVFLYIIF